MARTASRCGANARGPRGLEPNRPPSAGHQSIGTERIDGANAVMTVALHDGAGRVVHAVDLPPAA
jgi:hypothetical protein